MASPGCGAAATAAGTAGEEWAPPPAPSPRRHSPTQNQVRRHLTALRPLFQTGWVPSRKVENFLRSQRNVKKKLNLMKVGAAGTQGGWGLCSAATSQQGGLSVSVCACICIIVSCVMLSYNQVTTCVCVADLYMCVRVCVCRLICVCCWLCSAEAASEHGGAAAPRGPVRQEDLHRTSTAHPPAGGAVSHSGTVCV